MFRRISHVSRWPGQRSLLSPGRETAFELPCSVFQLLRPHIPVLRALLSDTLELSGSESEKVPFKDSKIWSDTSDFRG